MAAVQGREGCSNGSSRGRRTVALRKKEREIKFITSSNTHSENSPKRSSSLACPRTQTAVLAQHPTLCAPLWGTVQTNATHSDHHHIPAPLRVTRCAHRSLLWQSLFPACNFIMEHHRLRFCWNAPFQCLASFKFSLRGSLNTRVFEEERTIYFRGLIRKPLVGATIGAGLASSSMAHIGP